MDHNIMQKNSLNNVHHVLGDRPHLSQGKGSGELCYLGQISLVPSPKSLHGEGSGDIGNVSWLYKVSNGVTMV